MVPGTDTQDLLGALMQQGKVTHFELARPSLHDIFVRIAGPEALETEEEDGDEYTDDDYDEDEGAAMNATRTEYMT